MDLQEWVVGRVEERRTAGRSVTIGGLHAYQNYTIQVAATHQFTTCQVAASTSAGEGLVSTSVYCRTRETVPGPPGDARAIPIDTGPSLDLFPA